MAAYIAIFLSLLSIVLMIVILVRFKKLFSTDAIIEKTKSQMNRVIMDVNNNANRDLELLNESTRRLRALLNDAEKRMESFREASQLLRDMIAEAEKAGSSRQGKIVYVENPLAEKNENKSAASKTKKSNPYIDPDSSYKVRNSAAGSGTENQRSLFDDEDENEDTFLKDETLVTKDGAAYKEVPLIITKVYDDKTADAINSKSQSQNNLEEKVQKLFAQGMKVDDIAAELSCSISEVQFIIDLHV